MTNSSSQRTPWTNIMNLWFGFIAAMVVISNLPHAPLSLLNWINLALYSFALLTTISLVKNDTYYRDVFISLAICFFAYCLFLPYILIGDQYLIKNNDLGWFAYKFLTLFTSFTFVYSIVYYAAKHALRPAKPWLLIISTLALTTAAFYFSFGSQIFQQNPIFTNKTFYQKAVTYYLLPLSVILAYGFLYPLFKPKHGQYYHSLMIIFALLSFREVFSHFANMKELFMFNLDQVFLTTTLIAMDYFLAKRLSHQSSTTGKIYSAILNNDLNIPNLKLVGRDKNQFSRYQSVINYFYSIKFYILPGLFLLLLLINFVDIPLIVSLNLIAFTVVAFIGIFLFIISYNNKMKNGGFVISPKGKE